MNRTAKPLRALLLAGALLLAPVGASAQSIGIIEDTGPGQKDVKPPDPGNPTPPNTGVIYILLFLLVGASIGLAILPSHRTHQD
jgi:hypothetical protein